MPSDRSRQALEDIRDNCVLAQEFVGSRNADDFENDAMAVYATIRCLEIISEASRRIDEPVLVRGPDLPWRDIRAAGNVYRHEYAKVAPKRIWLTVTNSLPRLLDFVTAELSRDT